MTPILGETENRAKKTCSDPKTLPGRVMEQPAAVLSGSNDDEIHRLKVPREKLKVQWALKTYGFKEEDIDNVADLACASTYPSPRQIEKEPIN
jgi:alcohol dehydrogenase class IV